MLWELMCSPLYKMPCNNESDLTGRFYNIYPNMACCSVPHKIAKLVGYMDQYSDRNL